MLASAATASWSSAACGSPGSHPAAPNWKRPALPHRHAEFSDQLRFTWHRHADGRGTQPLQCFDLRRGLEVRSLHEGIDLTMEVTGAFVVEMRTNERHARQMGRVSSST